MADFSFADHLHAGTQHENLRQGCGLLGFVRNAFWYYERHGRECRPGMWSVNVGGHEAGEFYRLLTKRADAVVDDFGDLRLVEVTK